MIASTAGRGRHERKDQPGLTHRPGAWPPVSFAMSLLVFNRLTGHLFTSLPRFEARNAPPAVLILLLLSLSHPSGGGDSACPKVESGRTVVKRLAGCLHSTSGEQGKYRRRSCISAEQSQCVPISRQTSHVSTVPLSAMAAFKRMSIAGCVCAVETLKQPSLF